MTRRRIGLIVFILGVLLAAWIGYDLFLDGKPPAPGQNVVPGIITAVCLLFFGFLWSKR